MEEIVEVIRLVPQERIQERIEEEIIDVSDPQMTEDIVEVVKRIPEERAQNCAVEHIVDVPVPQIRKEIGEEIQCIVQERTSDRVVEQIVDVPVPEIGDQIVEIVKGIPREHLRQHIERFMEGMRRRTFEDYTKLEKLEVQEGADFIGVKWVTECPQMKLIIIDFVSRCLGPLPDGVVDYCSKCVPAGGIKKFMLDRAEASKIQEDVVAG